MTDWQGDKPVRIPAYALILIESDAANTVGWGTKIELLTDNPMG